MPKRSCPHCARRLPYAARRCLHCGWTHGASSGRSAAGWRRARAWAVTALMLAAVATHFAYRNAGALVDWYAGFAARFLPATAASSSGDSQAGAYFFCARQVARKMPDDLSVETFDAAGGRTVALGNGRYRVQSVLDAAGESGVRSRHDFTCVARFEGGRWVLEELRLESVARNSSLLADVRARSTPSAPSPASPARGRG